MTERRVIAAIPVEVRRTRRRRTRIGLAFDPSGYVILEAPLDASEAEIHSVVVEHHRWLRHRLDKAQDSHGLSASLRYVSGELLHFGGDAFELVVEGGARNDVRLCRRRAEQMPTFPGCSGVRGELRVTLGAPVLQHRGSDERVRGLVNEWYRARANECFLEHLEYWCLELPWLAGRLPYWRHRFMRSQWGSCSVTGRISLNTHLVKTPARLIGYVALHELCHLQHHDHGPRFYRLMTRYMPDWQQHRTELDRYLPVLLQE